MREMGEWGSMSDRSPACLLAFADGRVFSRTERLEREKGRLRVDGRRGERERESFRICGRRREDVSRRAEHRASSEEEGEHREQRGGASEKSEKL